ncbi:P1 [Pseudomonas phage phi2954]|uniref:p1 n=1 Tax=Pseudomonas phage phi2954 TaxID=593131 RepID=C0KIT9_9VIRU|nr:P1 [Pseudomonas phage phi2954]ACM91124.1 P1 [Pseudomonas phage phi2954]
MAKKNQTTSDRSVVKNDKAAVVHTKFEFPADFGLVNAEVGSLHVTIRDTIIDKRAGTTVVHEVMGESPNLDVIAHHLANEGVRQAVADFILTRKVTKVITNATPVTKLRQGEIVLMRETLLRQLNGEIADQHVCGVMAEFVIALARKAKVISDSVAITISTHYPSTPVTIEGLTEDLIAQSAVRTMEGVSLKWSNSENMSREAFADAFAEALIPVGYALISTNDLTQFFNDVVKAIRARLLISEETGTIGMIDDKWLHHPMVTELSTNYIFLEAARSLPYGSTIQTTNSAYSLERDASIVLASLKSSRRFAIVKTDEYRATYGKMTLVDGLGAPCYFYGWRAASMHPVAQNVSAFDDATMPGKAMTIVPGSEVASKFIATAFPSGTAASIDYHLNKLATMRQHLLDTKDPQFKAGLEIGETFIFGEDGLAFSQELACLLADKVFLSKDMDDTLVWNFIVETKHRFFYQSDLQVNLIGDMFYTKNIGLALLMMKDFTPVREIEPRSQLLGEKALFTRVLDMPETRMVSPDERITYALEIGGGKYTGSIRAREVGMNDLPISAKFVRPVFNYQVSQAINEIQKATTALIAQAQQPTTFEGEQVIFANDSMVAYMRQARIQSIVDMAREVSAQYRQTVEGLLKIKSVSALTASDAMQARGVLAQAQFMGYADIIALLLVMKTNGMETAFITEALKSEALIPALLAGGTDRKPVL